MKKIMIVFVFSIFLILLFLRLNNKKYYQDAINTISYNYNNTLSNINVFNNINYHGTLTTKHTSNLVHMNNYVYEEVYDFKLKSESNKLYVYLEDKYTIIDLNKFFQMNNLELETCEYKKRIKDKNSNINIYKCENNDLEIYTSKVFNRYVKSIIKNNNYYIEFKDNTIIYKNDLLHLEFSNISANNYVLNANYDGKNFKIFYSVNEHKKYSFMFDLVNFNIIFDESIILSMKCNTKRYSNLNIMLENSDINKEYDYIFVKFDDMMNLIFNEEIYDLFK